MADGEPIAEATAAELPLTEALVGKKISVAVTGTLEGAEAVTARSSEVVVRAAGTTDPGTGPGTNPGTDPGNQTPAPGGTEPSVKVVTDGPLRPGDAIAIQASGFTAGETVSLTLHPDPIHLGDVLADASGKVSARITLPENAPAGLHHIQAKGLTSGKVASWP